MMKKLICAVGFTLILANCEKPVSQEERERHLKKTYDTQFVKVTITGLNQFKNMPTVVIEDRAKIQDLVNHIGDEPPGPSIDYNEKYRIVFTMRNGKEIIMRTLYTDRHWHYEGKAEDHPMKEGFAEYMKSLLHQK
jgi:hypothetical protein